MAMLKSLSVKQRLSEPENVKLVTALLLKTPAPSRHSLAKELCRRLDLKDGKGDWRMATTSKALRECEDQRLWTLPVPRSSVPRLWSPSRLTQSVALPRERPKLL